MEARPEHLEAGPFEDFLYDFSKGGKLGIRKTVAAFQQEMGISSDGKIGPKTLEAMQRYNPDKFEEVILPALIRADLSATASFTPSDSAAGNVEAEDILQPNGGSELNEEVVVGNKDETTLHQSAVDERSDEEEPEPPIDQQKEAVAQAIALSDMAVEFVKDDKLGFEPSVEAVVQFLLSENTTSPLTIAVHAPWGKGKTSFMKMIDNHLKGEAEGTGIKVGTAWFNPWQFSAPEQVWGAFVSKVVTTIKENLNPWELFKFKCKKTFYNLRKQSTATFFLNVLVLFLVTIVIGTVAVTGGFDPFLKAVLGEVPGLNIGDLTANVPSYLGWVFHIALGMLAVLFFIAYIGSKVGLDLIAYLKETDFKDKVGSLSQFSEEMEELNRIKPQNLKLIIFIDDLDRCSSDVLKEMVEALQLTTVSRTCIFILGMDLHIVARTIESSLKDLVHAVGDSDDVNEHGGGYKFLEKIVQARVSIPSYGKKEIAFLASQSLHKKAVLLGSEPKPDEKGDGAKETGKKKSKKEKKSAMESVGETVKEISQSVGDTFVKTLGFRRKQVPKDSEAVEQAIGKYGPDSFKNPRRLKRFINSFRLHAYLLDIQQKTVSMDTLARFLILAEKWPYVLKQILEGELRLDETAELPNFGNKNELEPLLIGTPMIKMTDLEFLAEWYDFQHVISKENNKESSKENNKEIG